MRISDWSSDVCSSDLRGTQAVIPPRRNRKIQYDYDKVIYRQRNVIERMFCRLKDWRRIATRFDRNIKNFMSAVALAAAVTWWRSEEHTSELPSLMRISYAVFCLKKKKNIKNYNRMTAKQNRISTS